MRHRKTKAPRLILDHVVTCNGRYLMPLFSGSQYTDLMEYAAKTTRDTAAQYLGRPGYAVFKLEWPDIYGQPVAVEVNP